MPLLHADLRCEEGAKMITILYVDDEPALLELARLFLERSGEFQVATSTSAREVLSSPAIRSYDAIISDYQMPDMDGIAFLKAVREQFGEMPFILFTGKGREEVVIEAINNGADFYVQKGGDPKALFAELAHKVRQAVRRKRAEASLAEQEQRYHDLQNANDLIQSVAPDGHFLFVNAKWLDTLGYTAEDLPDLTIFDVIHEESIGHCMETFRRVISGENVGIIDTVFTTRDGRKIYVEGIADSKIVDGECRYTRGIFKDVTERKRMEAALAENHDFLDRIVASVQSGIMIIDARTHEIVDLNPAAARMIGAVKEQVVGQVCHRYVCTAESGRCPITDLHQNVDNTEHTLLTADGRTIDIIKYVVPFNFNGRECLLETFIDNTDRKKAADELQAAYEKVTVAEEELRENYELLHWQAQAVRESTETLRAVVEQSNEGIVIADPAGKILYANHRAADIVESPQDLDAAGGSNVLDFIPLDLHERAIGRFEKVLQECDPSPASCRIATPGNREKWLECVGRRIVFKGSPAVLLSFRDVTGRMAAEKRLRDSEHMFATVFRSNPVPLTLTSASGGVFIDVNDAFLQSSGYTREEVIGKTAKEMDFFVDEDENARFVSKLRDERSVHGVDLRCRNKAGEIRTCRFSSSIISIDSRPHILSVIEDISEYKQAQEAIRESGERYRLILKTAHEGILINEVTARGPGRFIDVNESACRILGMTRDELQDARLIDLDVPEMQRRVPGILRDLSRNGHAVFQTSYLAPDNRERALEISTSLLDLNGQQTLLSVVRDVTELRAAESALNALIAGMVGATGRESFDRITESISTWLGADCVMIGEITPDRERVRVLSMLLDGEKIPEYFYPLKGAPCEDAVNNGFCNHPDSAAWLFSGTRDLCVSGIRGYAGTVLHNPEGQGVGLLCIFSRAPLDLPPSAREILEIVAAKAAAEIGRLHALSALSESEEKYRNLVENSIDAVFLTAPDGTVISANSEACRIFGMTEEELIRAGRDGVVDHTDPRLAPGLEDRARTGRFKGELRFRRKDGTVFPAEISSAFFKDVNGRTRTTMVVRDVTERVAAAEALRQSEERFRTIFENSPQPITVSSVPDNRFIRVNAAFLAVTGYAEDEVLERTPVELGMISHADAARLETSGLLEGTIRNMALPLTVRGGRRIHIVFSTIPLTIDGRPVVVTMAAETTDLKRAELELVRKNTELTTAEEELRTNYERLVQKDSELVASESRYRTLFENMINGFTYCRMIYDREGNPDDFVYLQTNRMFLQFAGLDEMAGKRATEVFPDIRSTNPELFEIYGRVARTGIPETFRFYFKRFGKWLNAAVYSPEKGCFAVVFEDFTERKRAEEALRKSEEMLALVMDGVPTLLSYLDVELRFVYINKAHAAWYGRPKDELIGRSIRDLLPKEVFLRIASNYEAVLEGQEVTFESLNRDLDGREHIFAVQLVPHIQDGKVVGIFSALHDITRRKQMEEALKESETRFHSMFERHGSIMLIIESETGRILDANLAAERFYGRTRDELRSLSMRDIRAGPHEGEGTDGTGAKDAFFTSPHRVAGGGTRIVEVHCSPISMQGRTVLFAIINDVTERRRMEDALKQANKKLNLLSGITRHDINNQLQILEGYLMLSREENRDPSFSHHLTCIATASSRISSMIEFTKEYEEVGVCLPVWRGLRVLVDDAARSAVTGRVALENAIPADMEVFADPLISKVFFNLIDNALRHGGKTTTIRFASEVRDGDCIVVCEDDGGRCSGKREGEDLRPGGREEHRVRALSLA